MGRRRDLTELRRIIALLRPHAAGEGRPLVLGVLLAATAVVLQVARPWPLKWILDYLGGAGDSQAVVSLVSRAPALGIAVLCALFVASSLAGAAAEYAQLLRLTGVGNRVVFRFRAAFFGHLLRQSLTFHESREPGELLTRVVSDTARLRRGVNGILVRVFQTLALFAATLAVLLWVSVPLGLVLAAGGVLAFVAMRQRGRRIAQAARLQRRKEGKLASLVAGELRSIRELQAFAVASSTALPRFVTRNDKSLRQESKVQRLSAGLLLRVEAVFAFAIAIALWLGSEAVRSGRLTPGDLVLFISYAAALRAPLSDFAYQAARLGRTYACAERLADIAERVPEIADRPDAVDAPTLRGEISFVDVTVRAPRRVRTGRKLSLDHLSCDLPVGKRIAIVGPNGAGKSTLLRLVLRLGDPASGTVRIDGRPVSEYTIDSIRRQMSVVFQGSVFPGLSVKENLTLGTPEASDDAVRAAVAAAQARALIERLPAGYDTIVRRGGDLFSGGERQRLAIARALLRDGRIWLLDEPSTGLDPETAADLVDILWSATRGRTTLWVTHDMSLLPRMDWVLALDRGAVIYAGTPAAFDNRHRSSPPGPSLLPMEC